MKLAAPRLEGKSCDICVVFIPYRDKTVGRVHAIPRISNAARAFVSGGCSLTTHVGTSLAKHAYPVATHVHHETNLVDRFALGAGATVVAILLGAIFIGSR